MGAQLLIGGIVAGVSVIALAAMLAAAETALNRGRAWLGSRPRGPRIAAATAAVTLWTLTAHALGVWLWALAFLSIGVFDQLEPALYFSAIAFTTLGFGDVLLPEQWRLLGGVAAANGLVNFGVSTAFLMDFFKALRRGAPRREASRPDAPRPDASRRDAP